MGTWSGTGGWWRGRAVLTTRCGGYVGLSLVFTCLMLAGPPASAATRPHNVLVLYSFGRLLPANLEGDRGVREVFAMQKDLPITTSFEFLDNPRFSGDAYERTFVAYLRDKYASMPPDVIMVAADEALDFVLRHRDELFARVPIVHMNVTTTYLRSIPALPVDVIGTPITYDYFGTVEQALRWQPGANRLVVVTGSNAWDRAQEAQIRAQLGRLPASLSIDFLAGLPTEELLRRLRQLQPGAIVLTPGFFVDGSGRESAPRESTEMIAKAAAAPVYVTFSTQLGTGVVGGRMAGFREVGRTGARTAIALLEGIRPEAVRPPATMPTPLQVDWRQLERWKIGADDVPQGAIVWFREPTLWQAHRDLVLLWAVVILVQAGLIAALLFERRRRRLTVAALARSEQHLRLAGQAARLSAWVLHEESNTKPDARDVGNAAPAAAAADPLRDFRDTLARVSPQDRPAVDAAVRHALETGGGFDVEYRIGGNDGQDRWEAAWGNVDPAQASRLVGVAIDITERKRAEMQTEIERAALYHMSRVSLLGQLSAAIAHQLNQPLASIRANAEAAQKMLEREPLDVAELREICADIVTDDHRAADVIRQLGALFRRGLSKFEPIDLNELIRDSLDLVRGALTTRRVTVTTDLAPSLPPISGDRVQLQQHLLNLIMNAADAMAQSPGGGREVTITTALHGPCVRLCVADKGPGVPAEVRDNVFEPFWSTREGGMGMGLAVCRSIVTAHHGSLTVADAPKGGAEFCTTLPAMVPS